MSIGHNELKRKLDEYFQDSITKKELGEWAGHEYIKLLKGGYIEKNSIAVYPFLKVISQIGIEVNEREDRYPCSETEVREIWDVLHGMKEIDFKVEIAVSPLVRERYLKEGEICQERILFFSKIYQKICNCVNNNLQSFEGVGCEIVDYLKSNKIEPKGTLLECLEERIDKLSKALFNVNDISVKVTNLALYTGQTKRNFDILKLLECIECYIGIRSFNIVISYRNGNPEILLLV